MKHRHQTIVKVLTILSAAALLFVVVFPYTPTPIALSIGKILVAVAVLSACVLVSRLVAVEPVLTFTRHSFVLAAYYSVAAVVSRYVTRKPIHRS
ncbi:MAG: hypothetical protein HY646_19430 [Acidobacteria bacterium]|nr:hypothetical protein [Acidobacteriota bacterium]